MPESILPKAAPEVAQDVARELTRGVTREAVPEIASSPAQEVDYATGEYAVRVGLHGQVGRFASEGEIFRRGARVVCRTARGLEIGTVLNPLQGSLGYAGASDGQILRRMTAEDQLLWNNLEQLAGQSHEACQQWLTTSNSSDRLLDVEPLLDGRTLYFHFLNQASPETDAQLERLVAIFQETVNSSPFSHLLEHGCGPGCGTAAATRGCGTACHSCAASNGCGVRR